MKEDFAEMWEGKSEEELFSHYIETVAGVYKTGLHKRRAAARILARRKHQPTGEILTRWLNNPKKGIGKYEEHEWGTATSQPYTWYLADTEERHITHLAAESLGLMRYEKARVALEKLLLGNRIAEYSLETSLGNLEETVRWALKRLDNSDTPENGIEDDMLLYIATAYPDFFREAAFKGFANKMISMYGRDVARKYIEGLRKVPDIHVPNIHVPTGSRENDYFFRYKLIPLMAPVGFLYGRNQEEFGNICQELFNIVKTSKGYARGVSNTSVFLSSWLYDGSDANLNDGVELTVKEYVDKISQQLLYKVL